jgi:hypothetical protein
VNIVVDSERHHICSKDHLPSSNSQKCQYPVILVFYFCLGLLVADYESDRSKISKKLHKWYGEIDESERDEERLLQYLKVLDFEAAGYYLMFNLVKKFEEYITPDKLKSLTANVKPYDLLQPHASAQQCRFSDHMVKLFLHGKNPGI